ncbi:MAG TPA: sigma-54 dependent transcriptional regulator [Phycisphaerales bacterium]|nr:sigma-54 dependent transcriptional regulator [Phycisphaerales bacterium]
MTIGSAHPSAATPRRILVADADAVVAGSLADFFRDAGHEAASATATAEVERLLEAQGCAIAFIDASVAGEGLELLRTVGKKHAGVACVVTTSYGSVESAVEALRLGACDYLTKPYVEGELLLSLTRAERHHVLLAEAHAARARLAPRERNGRACPSSGIVLGGDPRMRRVMEMVRAVAPSKTTVLMTGESGTGKSLIARAIHDASARADKPFVELSCGSIPETLLESELFGHVKGAFTGAHTDKAGRFQAAAGGTLFLDEINSATPAMQLKLLRVLQEKRFEPVGSSETREADVRVILASNQPLEELVARGAFRQDLYYRINVVKIEVPALRERPSDVVELAEHFLAKYSAEMRRVIAGFSPEAIAALRAYPFPGNVRELQNIVERACVLAQGQTITLHELPEHVPSNHAAPAAVPPLRIGDDEPWTPMSLEEALREPERRILLRALEANHWNRQKTADQLGVNRTTLYKKMKALGVVPGEPDAMAG